jgi:AraC-like DNA-binding protein
MTFYQREISRIRDNCYSNEGQLDTVIAARSFISGNFDHELNLDLLSRICYVSKFHLLRLFKKYYGQTPQQYLTDKRIEKSKEYLKKGMSISDTSFAIGFESPSSFSTLFKCRTGLSPTEFQKEQFSQSRFNSDL